MIISGLTNLFSITISLVAFSTITCAQRQGLGLGERNGPSTTFKPPEIIEFENTMREGRPPNFTPGGGNIAYNKMMMNRGVGGGSGAHFPGPPKVIFSDKRGDGSSLLGSGDKLSTIDEKNKKGDGYSAIPQHESSNSASSTTTHYHQTGGSLKSVSTLDTTFPTGSIPVIGNDTYFYISQYSDITCTNMTYSYANRLNNCGRLGYGQYIIMTATYDATTPRTLYIQHAYFTDANCTHQSEYQPHVDTYTGQCQDIGYATKLHTIISDTTGYIHR